MNYLTFFSSPLGDILLASDGEALTGLWFEGQRRFAHTVKGTVCAQSVPPLESARRWLDAYFSGGSPDFAPPLCPAGTAFQQAVWALLREIPYGQTTTYGALARTLAARQGLAQMSAQAVGHAVACNPIALLIPCHRVLGANGELTGYAGGLPRKQALLALENGETIRSLSRA